MRALHLGQVVKVLLAHVDFQLSNVRFGGSDPEKTLSLESFRIATKVACTEPENEWDRIGVLPLNLAELVQHLSKDI